MIDSIRISGFKCLMMEAPIRLGNICALVGANASGKSSFMQALLLLRQSGSDSGELEDLHLSGELYEAGTILDALNPSAQYSLNIDLRCGETEYRYAFVHDRENQANRTRHLHGEIRRLPKMLVNSGQTFCYLNAERVGPRVSYPLSPDYLPLAGPVGKFGEYTASRLARSAAGDFIHDWSDETARAIAATIQLIDGRDLEDALIASQGRLDLVVNIVLGWIIPGASFLAEENHSVDSAPLQFIRDLADTRAPVRATHVGFGLANCLPIIVGSLAVQKGGLILVENPEAHLHPYSQSRMGAFLSLVSSLGRQIILETHSDHVVNGIRLEVKVDETNMRDVVFNYFEPSIDHSVSYIRQIFLSEDGSMDSWPRGFFDQIEQDLARL